MLRTLQVSWCSAPSWCKFLKGFTQPASSNHGMSGRRSLNGFNMHLTLGVLECPTDGINLEVYQEHEGMWIFQGPLLLHGDLLASKNRNFSGWFSRWTGGISSERIDNHLTRHFVFQNNYLIPPQVYKHYTKDIDIFERFLTHHELLEICTKCLHTWGTYSLCAIGMLGYITFLRASPIANWTAVLDSHSLLLPGSTQNASAALSASAKFPHHCLTNPKRLHELSGLRTIRKGSLWHIHGLPWIF